MEGARGDLKIICNAGYGILNNLSCGRNECHKVVLSVILSIKCASVGGGPKFFLIAVVGTPEKTSFPLLPQGAFENGITLSRK